MVEDALAGVKAARAAGMHCVAIPTAHSRSILELGVELFDSLSDVVPELPILEGTTDEPGAGVARSPSVDRRSL